MARATSTPFLNRQHAEDTLLSDLPTDQTPSPFHLGAVWRPETWPDDQWPADIARMQDAGVNAVRLFDSAWHRFEPREWEFDFEWANKNLFFGQYSRTKSYFDNSELASSGLPSPEELKILEPFRGKIPDEVFSKEFTLPTTDGSGNIPYPGVTIYREWRQRVRRCGLYLEGFLVLA